MRQRRHESEVRGDRRLPRARLGARDDDCGLPVGPNTELECKTQRPERFSRRRPGVDETSPASHLEPASWCRGPRSEDPPFGSGLGVGPIDEAQRRDRGDHGLAGCVLEFLCAHDAVGQGVVQQCQAAVEDEAQDDCDRDGQLDVRRRRRRRRRRRLDQRDRVAHRSGLGDELREGSRHGIRHPGRDSRVGVGDGELEQLEIADLRGLDLDGVGRNRRRQLFPDLRSDGRRGRYRRIRAGEPLACLQGAVDVVGARHPLLHANQRRSRIQLGLLRRREERGARERSRGQQDVEAVPPQRPVHGGNRHDPQCKDMSGGCTRRSHFLCLSCFEPHRADEAGPNWPQG